MKVDVIKDLLEYGTDRPVEVGRLELEDGYVILALRYIDEDGEWFPTWVGPKGNAVQVPRGFALPAEMVDALKEAAA